MATYLITRFNHFDCYLDNHSTKLSTIKYNTKLYNHQFTDKGENSLSLNYKSTTRKG